MAHPRAAYFTERKRIQRASRQAQREFIGADGEGGTIDGKHEYLLFRVGHETLNTGKPLRINECLEFIANLDPNPIYVGYYFDYDVTMILRDMPAERIERLLAREKRTTPGYVNPAPIDYGPYQIDYMAHKEFKVRRKGAPCPRCNATGHIEHDDESYDCIMCNGSGHTGHSKWVVISDVGSFFQCSFVAALEKWEIGTTEDRRIIAEGKEKRADFVELTEESDVYNAKEIELLEQLMEAFRKVCQDIGYVPNKWQGPGYVTSKMLERNGVPKTRTLDFNPRLAKAAQASFYGGRFETTAFGTVQGPVYQYDINSAYPYALTQLPCLRHGQWRRTDSPRPGSLYLAHIHYSPKEKASLYGFPNRTKQGSISFPESGSGWYWSPEIESAIHQKIIIDDGFEYERECECEPFDFIPDVYAERLRIGKTAKGIVLKLALNSLYGKMCQSIGSAPYANPIYAGLITSITRAQLMSLAHSGPRCCADVYMLATDGVFCGKPRTIEPNKQLGGWDLETHPEGMFIIQPGLYFTSDNVQPKTRGVPRRLIVEYADQFRQNFNIAIADGWPEPVIVPLISFIGLRLAIARNKPELAGQWMQNPRRIAFAVESKRKADKWQFDKQGNHRTEPLEGGEETVPYSKDIGKLLERRALEYSDNPDWTDIAFLVEQ